MPRFAANLSMMFNEVPFLDRFDAAAQAGFAAVEYLFPYEHPPEAIADRLKRNGLTQALFNLPPGNWAAGERGLAALPGPLRRVARRRCDGAHLCGRDGREAGAPDGGQRRSQRPEGARRLSQGRRLDGGAGRRGGPRPAA